MFPYETPTKRMKKSSSSYRRDTDPIKPQELEEHQSHRLRANHPESKIHLADAPGLWPAERTHCKRFEDMWSSSILPLGLKYTSSPDLRKKVPHQEPEADKIIRMDYGLKYKEDNITGKIK